MVGAGRFELPTPTTPLWCATRLRYAPTETEGESSRLKPLLQGGHDNRHIELKEGGISAPQDLKNLFKFYA